MGGNISDSLFFPLTAPDGTEVLPYETDGSKSCWRWSKEKIEEENHRIEWIDGENGWKPYYRIYADQREGRPPETIWNHEEVGSNRTSKNEIRSLFGSNKFPTPKPEGLLQKIIRIGSEEGDLILDFFAGSGTTGAVAHKMGRQYIVCEQMDYIETVTSERLQKVIQGEQGGISEEVGWGGGGSFVYTELMKWNQKYAERIRNTEDEEELLEIWKSMKDEAFLSYKVDPQEFDENVTGFKELDLGNQKKFLMECLDKNHLYVNLSEMDDEEYDISEEDKKMNEQFYGGF